MRKRSPASLSNLVRHLQMSDVRLLCLDSTRILNDWERDQLAAPKRPRQLVVFTKCDGPRRVESLTEAIETSATSGLGLTSYDQRYAKPWLAPILMNRLPRSDLRTVRRRLVGGRRIAFAGRGIEPGTPRRGACCGRASRGPIGVGPSRGDCLYR